MTKICKILHSSLTGIKDIQKIIYWSGLRLTISFKHAEFLKLQICLSSFVNWLNRSGIAVMYLAS